MVDIGGDLVKLDDYKFISWQVNNNTPTSPVMLINNVIDDIESAAKPNEISNLVIWTGISRALHDHKTFMLMDRAYFLSFMFSAESRKRLWNWLNDWR